MEGTLITPEECMLVRLLIYQSGISISFDPSKVDKFRELNIKLKEGSRSFIDDQIDKMKATEEYKEAFKQKFNTSPTPSIR